MAKLPKRGAPSGGSNKEYVDNTKIIETHVVDEMKKCLHYKESVDKENYG